MPELPDVGIFKKYFQSTALPQTIREVEVRAPELLEGVSAKRLRQELSGLAFSSAARHGKYLFAEAEGAGLVLHFGMTEVLK
jgi:formamidopyrimidine-DNA glycosylase